MCLELWFKIAGGTPNSAEMISTVREVSRHRLRVMIVLPIFFSPPGQPKEHSRRAWCSSCSMSVFVLFSQRSRGTPVKCCSTSPAHAFYCVFSNKHSSHHQITSTAFLTPSREHFPHNRLVPLAPGHSKTWFLNGQDDVLPNQGWEFRSKTAPPVLIRTLALYATLALYYSVGVKVFSTDLPTAYHQERSRDRRLW